MQNVKQNNKEKLIKMLQKEMKRSIWDAIYITHPEYDAGKKRSHGYYINPWNLKVGIELFGSYSLRKKLYKFIWEMKMNGKNLKQSLNELREMGYFIQFVKNL